MWAIDLLFGFLVLCWLLLFGVSGWIDASHIEDEIFERTHFCRSPLTHERIRLESGMPSGSSHDRRKARRAARRADKLRQA